MVGYTSLHAASRRVAVGRATFTIPLQNATCRLAPNALSPHLHFTLLRRNLCAVSRYYSNTSLPGTARIHRPPHVHPHRLRYMLLQHQHRLAHDSHAGKTSGFRHHAHQLTTYGWPRHCPPLIPHTASPAVRAPRAALPLLPFLSGTGIRMHHTLMRTGRPSYNLTSPSRPPASSMHSTPGVRLLPATHTQHVTHPQHVTHAQPVRYLCKKTDPPRGVCCIYIYAYMYIYI